MAPEKVVVEFPSKVVVPLLWINVPLLDQLPATVKAEEVGAIKVEDAEIIKFPSMFMIGLLEDAETVTWA